MLFEVDEGNAYFLGGHKTRPEHFAEVRSPEDEPYVRAGHVLHDDAPFTSEYSPAGQVKQDVEPAKEYSPSLQFEQVAVPSAGENFPAGHLPEH